LSDGLVSVITPFFNARPYLTEAVESVLAQSYRPLELLLVDDGSTDGSADCIAHLADTHDGVRLLRLSHNQGQAAARNAALLRARGEFLTFLDADDVMMPDRLAFQIDYLVTHRDVDVIIGSAEYVLEPGVAPPEWLRGPVAASRSRHRDPMTMLARRGVFDRVGLFDTSYRVGEDTEWVFRATAAGVGITKVDRIVIRRRIHGANLTYRAEEMRGAIRRIVLRSVRERIAGWRSMT
jgi:glycosyltransferase involved in cell wall biosynthesis